MDIPLAEISRTKGIWANENSGDNTILLENSLKQIRAKAFVSGLQERLEGYASAEPVNDIPERPSNAMDHWSILIKGEMRRRRFHLPLTNIIKLYSSSA